MRQPRDEPYPDTFIGGGFHDPSAPAQLQDPPLTLAPAPAPAPALPPTPAHRPRGLVPALAAVLCALLLVGHALVPNTGWNTGSLLETLLPWTALAIPPLLAAALIRRSIPAVLATLLLTATWAAMFGGQFVGSAPGARPNLTVVTHNVDAANPDPASTAHDLLAAHPDVVGKKSPTRRSPPTVVSWTGA